MNIIMLKDILLVILGGLFGWVLGQLSKLWVYLVMGLAILIAVVVLAG